MEQAPHPPGRRPRWLLAPAVLALTLVAGGALAVPESWTNEFPKTDFSKHSVDFDEIRSGGPPRDAIPAIDSPKFVPVSEAGMLSDTEPVIGLVVNGDARAYPLRILTWHEIVNDTVGGIPVTVTFCPLCNSGIAFERRIDGMVLDFGTTGKLRKSDLVMYDRQTESWWQQFMGQAIVGELTGKTLKMIPARMESFANFKRRAPHGKVLVPENSRLRPYGRNPYPYYDTASRPMLYQGRMPEGIEPMVRVVAVEGEAWSLPLLRGQGRIVKGDLVLSWESGQTSALDTVSIERGRDVGNVVVQRNGADVVHDVTFAFVFHAFHPDGVIHTE